MPVCRHNERSNERASSTRRHQQPVPLRSATKHIACKGRHEHAVRPAEDEGIACAEIIAGKSGHVNYDAIAGIIYTNTELAGVGLTEDQAKEKGIDVRIGKFPFRANSRALANEDLDGMVKFVADGKTDRILGAHILQHAASELIAEAVSVIEFGGSSEDIGRTCHSHPTLSEAVREAALNVEKRALHILNR